MNLSKLYLLIACCLIFSIFQGCADRNENDFFACKNYDEEGFVPARCLAPTETAKGISLTDEDPKVNSIRGTITINKAEDEKNLTHYVLYWGSAESTKLQNQNAIVTKKKTGKNIIYSLEKSISIPSGATHFLVFTKNDNADAEAEAGFGTLINEFIALPTSIATEVTFEDEDQDTGQLSGTVTVIKAEDEENLTHYFLYWGTANEIIDTNGDGKPGIEDAIESIPKTGANVSFSIAANTQIPGGATHFLVFTSNAVFNAETPKSQEFKDAPTTTTGTDADILVTIP